MQKERALAVVGASCSAALSLKEIIEQMGLTPLIVDDLPLDRRRSVVGNMLMSSSDMDGFGRRLVALWQLNDLLYNEMIELLPKLAPLQPKKRISAKRPK